MPRARQRRDNVDIWPGFVDALSTLLMVIIFLLAVFMLAQFFLQRIIEGQDKTVDNLESNLAAYERQLMAERGAMRALQLEMTRLNADIGALRDEREALLNAREAAENETFAISQQLFQALEQATALRTDLGARDNSLQSERRNAAELAEQLDRAEEAFAAERETVQTQLAELTRLRLDIEALNRTRDQLEAQIAELAANRAAQDEAAAREQDALRREQAAREAADQQVAQLSAQFVTLSTQIGSLEGVIETREALIREQQGAIADLALQLSQTLDRTAGGLGPLRAEWFDTIRRNLGTNAPVRLTGEGAEIRAAGLFGEGGATLSQEATTLFEMLASALLRSSQAVSADPYWTMRVDYVLAQDAAAAAGSEELNQATQRLGHIADTLIASGLPANRLIKAATLSSAGNTDNEHIVITLQ